MIQNSIYRPCYPRAVLRAGFAGKQKLTSEEEKILRNSIKVLLSIIQGYFDVNSKDSKYYSAISKYYSNDKPILRLISGLCEGADAIAGEELAKFKDNGIIEAEIAEFYLLAF